MFSSAQLRRTVAASLLILAVGGCASQPKEATPMAGSMVESQTLIRPLGGILADAVLAQTTAGKKLPDDFKTPEYVSSVIDSIRAQYPQAFAVTPEQEQDLAAGKTDDAANTNKLGKTLDKVDQQKVQLSTVNSYLAEQYKAGKLMGIDLELAARLIEAQLDATMTTELHK